MAYVFLDFEASSLRKQSYPIEIGWVGEDGAGESHLIRPAPAWTDWDERAAVIHGISRETLLSEGEPHERVCGKLIDLAEGNILLASAPSWDGHWLSMLLRAAGHPRHLIRLQDTEVAFRAAAQKRLGTRANETLLQGLMDAAQARADALPVAHRALADARREWSVWRDILERA